MFFNTRIHPLMPAPPKKENARNPLRQLRELLSDEGADSPIRQRELSRLTDIPLPTIRAIEAGQRSLNADALKKIHLSTRAWWNEERRCWTLQGDAKGEYPFTFSWHKIFKHFYGRRPPNYQLRVAFMHERLNGLFEKVEESDWHLLAARINDCLEGCKEHFKLQGLEKRFAATTPEAAAQFHEYLKKAPPATYLHPAPGED